MLLLVLLPCVAVLLYIAWQALWTGKYAATAYEHKQYHEVTRGSLTSALYLTVFAVLRYSIVLVTWAAMRI